MSTIIPFSPEWYSPEQIATRQRLADQDLTLIQMERNERHRQRQTSDPLAGLATAITTALRKPAASIKPDKVLPRMKSQSLSALLAERDETVQDIIAGFLPSASVNIMVGDSGLGKSPLLLQMALCVALGKNFLGMPVTRSRVLVVDYENPTSLPGMIETLTAHLGSSVSEIEDWLMVLKNPSDVQNVIAEAKQFGAGLITVDALRGLSPAAETKAEAASALITTQQSYPACWVTMHHLRKNDREHARPDLESEVPVLQWLEEASGHRALINQTSTRIGIDRSKKADLLLRSFYKTKGEAGALHIARIFSDDGEPVGYVRAEGRTMLSFNHKAWFDRLAGQSIKFMDVSKRLDAHHAAAADFIQACQAAGLAEVTGVAKSRTEPRIVRFRESGEVSQSG